MPKEKTKGDGYSSSLLAKNEEIRQNMNLNIALSEERRLDNIKYDSSNEAAIAAKQILKGFTLFTGPSIRSREDFVTTTITRLKKILEKDNRQIKDESKFKAGLIMIYNGVSSTDPSKSTLEAEIRNHFDRHIPPS